MTNATKFFKLHAADLRRFSDNNDIKLYVGYESLKTVGMYYIDSNNNDTIVVGESIIKRSPKHALIVLLHELGHFIAQKEGLYEKRKNTKMEECLAWLMAEALFVELDWPVTKKHYEDTKKRLLKSYGVKI